MALVVATSLAAGSGMGRQALVEGGTSTLLLYEWTQQVEGEPQGAKGSPSCLHSASIVTASKLGAVGVKGNTA